MNENSYIRMRIKQIELQKQGIKLDKIDFYDYVKIMEPDFEIEKHQYLKEYIEKYKGGEL